MSVIFFITRYNGFVYFFLSFWEIVICTKFIRAVCENKLDAGGSANPILFITRNDYRPT